MTEKKEDAKFFVTKFWPKLIERLQIAFVSMQNGRDLSEQDLDIVKAQHELYHTGRIEFDNLSSMDSVSGYTEPMSANLFSFTDDIGVLYTANVTDTVTEKPDGTEVEDNRA
jgi:hypothetical protein